MIHTKHVGSGSVGVVGAQSSDMDGAIRPQAAHDHQATTQFLADR